MRCPYCGSSNTRRRFRRHRYRNRRCRNCGRAFQGRSFPNVGCIALLLILAAIGLSIYYFKPKDVKELEVLRNIPADAAALEWESHRLINHERTKRGLQNVEWDPRLAEIARAHSRDMAENDFFSHDNLRGQDPTMRGLLANYTCLKALGGGAYSEGLGENILEGDVPINLIIRAQAWWNNQPADDLEQIEEAKAAVQRWMDSAGHRENILDRGYDRGGIGVGFNAESTT